jgi:hypothetical protein
MSAARTDFPQVDAGRRRAHLSSRHARIWHFINERVIKETVMIIELGKASVETKGTQPGTKLDPQPLVFPKIYAQAFRVD